MTVQACRGECGGLWFKQNQIKKLKHLSPGSGVSLLMINRAQGMKIYRGVEHVCPQCKITLLFRHFFSKEWDTEVNQCARCGGFWVDAAGLAKLQTITDPEKQQALKDYFSVILDEKIAGMHIINEDMAEAAQNMIRIFQFLCPERDYPKTGRKPLG